MAKFLIQPTNVLLLDEPTNHLDRATRTSLVSALNKYDGTIVCASHDPEILDTIATHVYEVKDGSCMNTRIIEPVVATQPSRKKKRKK